MQIESSILSNVKRSIRGSLFNIGWISLLINLLMLTGPLFMLQVYDRVLASGSIPTLLVISSLALMLYIFYAILEGLRSRMLVRIGQRVDAQLSATAYDVSTNLPLTLGTKSAQVQPVRDIDIIRQFLSGPGPSAIYDVPWVPLYLCLIFIFHPILGFVSLCGGVISCIFIGLNEWQSKLPVQESTKESIRRSRVVDESRNNAQVIRAMGMIGNLTHRWEERNQTTLTKQRKASDIGSLFSTLSKTFRFFLQSAMLAAGAWLAVKQEITPGVMIAASIITARALAPIDQAIGQWRGFVAARQSLTRLRTIFSEHFDNKVVMELPQPKKSMKLISVTSGPAGTRQPFIKEVTFELTAGDGLGIIGPSGSGKSTLAQTIVGILPTLLGSVTFDEAKLDQWSPKAIGNFIGYLPQDVQLFDGTVAENISRFQLNPDPNAIIEAAEIANVDELIKSLPDGYNTLIGQEGFTLSGGQRQRLALARALFQKPFLIVLDEPDSNLDSEGEAALTQAIKYSRDSGSIVIVIAHRPSSIAAVDKILCLTNGRASAFGPKEDVLKTVVAPVSRTEGVK